MLNIILPKRCPLCERDLSSNLCIYCQALCNRLPKTKNQEALFYYEFALRSLILKIKYGRSIAHMKSLSWLIDDALEETPMVLKEFCADAVTFVPTHWQKRCYRGFDLPSFFAQKIAQKLNVPVINTLKRQKLGTTQASIKSRLDREKSVQELFMVKTKNNNYNRLILVDDIITTGATADQTKKLLLNHSRAVKFFAIAKTP